METVVEADRKLIASTAPESNARPGSGFGMYVFVAVSMFAVGVIFFGKFYDVQVLDYPFVVVTGGAAVAGLSVLLRLSRMKRYRTARQIELEKLV
jgi:hypothetical protein